MRSSPACSLTDALPPGGLSSAREHSDAQETSHMQAHGFREGGTPSGAISPWSISDDGDKSDLFRPSNGPRMAVAKSPFSTRKQGRWEGKGLPGPGSWVWWVLQPQAIHPSSWGLEVRFYGHHQKTRFISGSQTESELASGSEPTLGELLI